VDSFAEMASKRKRENDADYIESPAKISKSSDDGERFQFAFAK
jgi:hypothetical protein